MKKQISNLGIGILILVQLSSCKNVSTEVVKDYDGNIYNTVVIGNQEWMTENLKTTHYNDGTPIPHVTDKEVWRNLTTPAMCWYDNNEAYKNTFGALYNWYVISTNKICPEGWRVPTEADWNNLENYLTEHGYSSISGENSVGKALASSQGWKVSMDPGTVGYNQEGNNGSGYKGYPGGIRFSNGDFRHKAENAKWWSADESSCSEAIIRFLSYEDGRFSQFSNRKENGFSIRCVRDIGRPGKRQNEQSAKKGAMEEPVSVGQTGRSRSVKTDFESWDEEKAREYILTDLKSQYDASMLSDFDFDSIKLQGLMRYVGLVQIGDRYKIYEFVKRQGRFNARTFPETDVFPYFDQVDIVKIANNRYGFLLESSEGAAGSTYESKELFTMIDSVVHSVFYIAHRFSRSTGNYHDFYFHIEPNDQGYYDIETYDNEGYDGDNYTPHKVYAYQFNSGEQQYVRGNTVAMRAPEPAEEIIADYSIFEDDNLSLEEVEKLKKQFEEGVGQHPYITLARSDYTYTLDADAPGVDESRKPEPYGIRNGIQRLYFQDSENVQAQATRSNGRVTEIIYFHPDGRIYTIHHISGGTPWGHVKYVDLKDHVILEGEFEDGKFIGKWNTPLWVHFDMDNERFVEQNIGAVHQMVMLASYYKYNKEQRYLVRQGYPVN